MPQKKTLNELAQVIADHQASLSRLGEAWGQVVADALDDTDRKLIARLESLVADVQANYRRNTAKAVNQLEYIRTKIEEIRVRAFVKAEKELRKAVPDLIENENNWSKKLLSELTGEAKTKFSDITDGQAEKLLKNSIQINRTWDQWWTNTAYGDTLRIADVINAGVVQGLTIPQMTRLIMGTKEGNYADGVLSTSRRHARNMARTLCAGISNQAKDQFYRDNADIVPQVEWLDTLDGRTCASCGGLSRQRFTTTEPHPVPPLHPQCRCVLIPVTELTDLGEDMPRPAANADFDAEAKRMYEEKYPQKRFEDLAPSTREQYRHKAVHAYEERTGKPAYNRAPGSMRFSDYLQQSTEQFKKDWLGPGRYDLYKTGKYPIEAFVPPYPNKAFTVKQVKELDIESFRRSVAEVKADDVPAVSKPEFVPAKTIEEATEWTKANRGANVNWKGIDLANLNIINSEMDSLSKDFPILGAKYKTVGTNNRMKAVAHANDELIEFSPQYINGDAIAKAFETHKNRAETIQKNITFYTEHSGFYGEKVSKREIAKLEKRIKFSRFGVCNSWDDPEKYVRGVVTHETGHTILFRKALEQRESAGKVKKTHPFRGEYEAYRITLEETDAYIAVNEAFKKAKKTGDIFRVSEYGNTDMHEFFAETFSMYRFEKDKLPDYIVSMIERVAK